MKHVCPIVIRTPFTGFHLSNVVQRQDYHIRSVVRVALGFGSFSSSRSLYTKTRSCKYPQYPSRDFSTSSATLARKRWIKNTTRPERDVARSWQDYDPEVGIPLESGELDQTTISNIFGPDMDDAMGNHILRLMNYRRISGSLIDVGAMFPAQTGVSQQMATKALDYLREQDPNFNEQEAGAAWAEAEVRRVEEEYMKRAENLGIYKKSSSGDQAREQASDDGPSVYGESALAALRRENKARWMEEDRKKAEAKERQRVEQLAQLRASGVEPEPQKTRGNSPETDNQSSENISLQRPGEKAWLQPTERKSWVKYYEEQATIVKENKIPQMSLLRRLGPAALVALGVVGACLTLHEMYVPPPKSARVFPDMPPAIATLGAITAINFAAFIAWRMPFMWRTMNKYFQVAPGYPFALSVFGAQFGHQSFIHLFTNTILLWPFGLMCKF